MQHRYSRRITLIRQQNKRNKLINDQIAKCYWNLHNWDCACAHARVHVCLESNSCSRNAKFKLNKEWKVWFCS